MRAAPLAIVVFVFAITACGSTGANNSQPAQSGPFQATGASVRALINDKLGNSGPDGPRVRGVSCSQGGRCFIQYDPDTYVFKVDEDLKALAPVWKELFSDPTFQAATFKAFGQTTSVGGQQSVSPLFTLSCDRNANSQINWDNVDAAGIKALCQWVPLVNFK